MFNSVEQHDGDGMKPDAERLTDAAARREYAAGLLAKITLAAADRRAILALSQTSGNQPA